MRAPRVGSPLVGAPRCAFQEGRFWKRSETSKRILRVAQNSFDESCAARITLELVCFSVAISLVFLDFQKNCSQRKPLKQVVRRSREEVTHTHLTPEGLCAPRKAEENLHCSYETQHVSCTALPKRKAAIELHCPDRKTARRWTGKTNEKTRTLVGEYCETGAATPLYICLTRRFQTSGEWSTVGRKNQFFFGRTMNALAYPAIMHIP